MLQDLQRQIESLQWHNKSQLLLCKSWLHSQNTENMKTWFSLFCEWSQLTAMWNMVFTVLWMKPTVKYGFHCFVNEANSLQWHNKSQLLLVFTVLWMKLHSQNSENHISSHNGAIMVVCVFLASLFQIKRMMSLRDHSCCRHWNPLKTNCHAFSAFRVCMCMRMYSANSASS